MSKIGKISINIPEKVKVALAGSDINIEGPLGKQKLKISRIALRQLGLQGKIPGMIKSSW